MAEKATLSCRMSKQQDAVVVAVQIHDEKALGREATLRIQQRVKVHDSSPVHATKELYQKRFRTDRRINEFTVPGHYFSGFTYWGSQIDLEYQALLKIDDAFFFDTKVNEKIVYQLVKKPLVRTDAEALIDPKDYFSFFSNVAAIPWKNKLLAMCLVVVGAVVILANMVVGLHDQMVPESATYIYSHRNSDGESQSPLVVALLGSGAAGAAVWWAMRRQLRHYMTFRFKSVPAQVGRATSVPIRQLIQGRSRVELKRAVLRVVACNLEKGQYVRGSGSNRRTVTFAEPFQAVLLFEQLAETIPPQQPIQDYFEGDVEFAPMFDALYPPAMVSDTHGIDVHWEVQLLFDQLVDQELEGSLRGFCREDFFTNGK